MEIPGLSGENIRERMRNRAELIADTTYVGFCQKPDGTKETIRYRAADGNEDEEEPFGGMSIRLTGVRQTWPDQGGEYGGAPVSQERADGTDESEVAAATVLAGATAHARNS